MTANLFSREPAYEEAEFVGRTAILRWVEKRLSSTSPQNINLAGEPRIGRTSTLHQVYARRLGLPPSTKGLYVWMPATELPVRTSQTFWKEMLSRLESKLPTDLVGPAVESTADAGETFDRLIERLEQLIEDHGYERIIYFIDDFDVLLPGIGVHDLDWLRSMVTRFRNQVAFVIASTDTLWYLTKDLQERSISPFHNVFSSRRLGLLTREEAVDLIQLSAKTSEHPSINIQHIEFLIREAGRHPDLLRIASEHFIDTLMVYGDSLTGESLYDAVRTDFRYDGHVHWLYEQLFARRTAAEQHALLDLAQGIRSGDTLLLNHLELHVGLIRRVDGDYFPFSDSFRAWLSQQVESTGTIPDTSAQIVPPPPSSVPTLYFDPGKRQVHIGDRVPMRLTKLEYRIVNYMIARVGQVCTHEDLLQHIWGGNRNKAVVEKAMNRLRSRLEPDVAIPQYIVSVRGQGYMLQNSEVIGNQDQ